MRDWGKYECCIAHHEKILTENLEITSPPLPLKILRITVSLIRKSSIAKMLPNFSQNLKQNG